MHPPQQLAVRRPAPPGTNRPRHVSAVRAVVHAWEQLSERERRAVELSLPDELWVTLQRLVDPFGLRGHADAVALAAAYRSAVGAAEAGDDELAEVLGFPLYWGVARLAQNLT
ncbi:hypothetical protein [Nocardioides houyundeii]|uniref:hypothetical protein n=1 Tax=Nocardioides houyundeii TaxID=2045452 RepID=UPI001315449F|nr:hypothetical protein [Nocardioides houyundeii]